jgi:hypothetical protein
MDLGSTVVKITNILRADFPPIFLRQKMIKANFKYKSWAINFSTKAAHKMLVKLTPGVNPNALCTFPFSVFLMLIILIL